MVHHSEKESQARNFRQIVNVVQRKRRSAFARTRYTQAVEHPLHNTFALAATAPAQCLIRRVASLFSHCRRLPRKNRHCLTLQAAATNATVSAPSTLAQHSSRRLCRTADEHTDCTFVPPSVDVPDASPTTASVPNVALPTPPLPTTRTTLLLPPKCNYGFTKP